MTEEKRTPPKSLRLFLILCLIVYLLLLMKVIVFKYPAAMMQDILSGWSMEGLIRHIQWVNILPFKTILSSLSDDALPGEIRVLAYNVMAFFPLGFLLPCITERLRKWWRALLVGLLVSGVLELIQLVTILGEADIDDVLLNGTGVLLGYGFFILVLALYQRMSPHHLTA